MRRTLPLLSRAPRAANVTAEQQRPPLIQLHDATFYRRQPSRDVQDPQNRPLFPGLSFEFPANAHSGEYWALVGPSNAGKTTLLEILQGKHLCFPPNARLFPYLSTDEIANKDQRLRHPARAIQYVGFDTKQKGLSGMGTYMSARYESRREVTDFSVMNYLLGNTQLNAVQMEKDTLDMQLVDRVVQDLNLRNLVDFPLSNLSNGQTRRARIAKALLSKPEVLLLDEPFMGLDPPTTAELSPLLLRLAETDSPRLILSFRPQDPIPSWISHVLYLGDELQVTHRGLKDDVTNKVAEDADHTSYPRVEDLPYVDTTIWTPKEREKYEKAREAYAAGKRSRALSTLLKLQVSESDTVNLDQIRLPEEPTIGEPVIEMNGLLVKYGDRPVLGNWRQRLDDSEADKPGLHWTVRRGERWGVFGPNGSGKTTLLSMITSDHPQSYSAPLKLFGRSRLPSTGRPGISLFELQSRIGHSSPEVHSFFPRRLTVRRTLESAWADTPLTRPKLTAEADARVDAALRWFQAELNPAAGVNAQLDALARRDQPRHPTEDMHPEAYRAQRQADEWERQEEAAMAVEWADELTFAELPFSAQRIALFLRAVIHSPDVIILDEAFSGLDHRVRDKCLLFLEHGEARRFSPLAARRPKQAIGWADVERRGSREMRDAAFQTGLTERQALIVVSHVKEEIPLSVRDWIYLPSAEGQPGTACRIGRVEDKPLKQNDKLWREIWGLKKLRGVGKASFNFKE